MIEQGFYKEMRKRILGCVSPSRYSQFMLRSIEYWKSMTFSDLEFLLVDINIRGGSYTLFPFCYIILQIDLYRYTIEKVNKEKSKTEVLLYIESFKTHKINHEEMSNILEAYKNTEPLLKNLSRRLISEGAYPIESLKLDLSKYMSSDNNSSI